MSISRHHAEWLSLLEISGPFLSMPVLLRAFPQGLDAHDADLTRSLRLAYDEWLDNQGGLRADPAIHRAWVQWVMENVLEMPPEVATVNDTGGLLVTLAEHGETIRPDFVVAEPGSGRARLLVMIVPVGQDLDKPLAGGRWKVSPAVRMMTLLHATGVRIGLATNGEQWMLVDAPKDGSTGYISWYAALWLEEPLTLRALRSLLAARRFFGVPDEQTIEALLADSADDQQQVTDQLGYQVRRAVELLVQAIDLADQDRGGGLLAGVDEAELYETAVTVMMRLVVLLAGEERDLLPLGDPLYDQHYAVSTLRAQLYEVADQQGEEVLERRVDAWRRLLATFRAVHGGIHHDRLHLPAYGGRLFDPDRFPFLEGRPAHTSWQDTPANPLPIHNRTVLHLLDALQMLRVKTPGGGPAEARRLSFRALDIEQIGHVYEGLLDHTAVSTGEPVIGLAGTRDREPEVPLSRLEEFVSRKDAKNAKRKEEAPDFAALAPLREHLREDDLLAFLREQTGRSPSALRKALAPLISHSPFTNSPINHSSATLRAACHNDDALLRRVLPWASLIRSDDYGRPVVIPAGSVYVTSGADRRSTGTHYTPPSLTEPIVQHTLEPLVYIGPAEGWPRERWRLRSAAEILAIRVCDMAMGSGAFLVQACRYLAERLVEAWEAESSRQDAENAKGEEAPAFAIFAPLREPDSARQDAENAKGEKDPDFAAFTPLREPDSARQDAKNAKGEEEAPGFAPLREPFAALRAAESDAERMIVARRLVAERCLYGVDKNPLAVEMAKLSLWLVTMAKGRPFGFLDHALKCGDSLVGVDEDQFLRWSQTLKGVSGPLYLEENQRALAEARTRRRQLQSFVVNDVRDAEEKARLLQEAEVSVARVRRGCDLLVGVDLVEGLSDAERAAWRAELLIEHTAKETPTSAKAQAALAAAEKHNAFHWFLEFPEVFERAGVAANPGFHAFVGNPPFIGGQRIRGALGGAYLQFLKNHWDHAKGSADLCAYFFLRAFEHLRRQGVFGLVATNTIAQGATRELGLDQISKNYGTIYRADTDYPWPGQASVVVDIISVFKGIYNSPSVLNRLNVQHISALLDDMPLLGLPKPLKASSNMSFQGSTVLGLGFTMLPESAQDLIRQNTANQSVLRPFLVGQDLNSNPDQHPSRWVINFRDWPLQRGTNGKWVHATEEQRTEWLRSGRVPDDYPGPVAADYPDCLAIVREHVYPERMRNRYSSSAKERWWQYERARTELYATIAPLQRVLVAARVTKYVNFVFVPNQWVYSEKIIVMPTDSAGLLALLQTSIHEIWAWQFSSTLGIGTLNYAPSDCFETFPFPNSEPAMSQQLDSVGETYHEHRRQIMLARQEGLTATYNRFHNPDERSADIARLRELHVAMDQAVAAAYGWDDLALGHGFHETAQGLRFTIDESARREVLGRLLALNHQRYAEEVAMGLHEKAGSTKARSGASKGSTNVSKVNSQLKLL